MPQKSRCETTAASFCTPPGLARLPPRAAQLSKPCPGQSSAAPQLPPGPGGTDSAEPEREVGDAGAERGGSSSGLTPRFWEAGAEQGPRGAWSTPVLWNRPGACLCHPCPGFDVAAPGPWQGCARVTQPSPCPAPGAAVPLSLPSQTKGTSAALCCGPELGQTGPIILIKEIKPRIDFSPGWCKAGAVKALHNPVTQLRAVMAQQGRGTGRRDPAPTAPGCQHCHQTCHQLSGHRVATTALVPFQAGKNIWLQSKAMVQ